jgi:hypothetical protein
VYLAVGFMMRLRPRKPHRAVSGSREGLRDHWDGRVYPAK